MRTGRKLQNRERVEKCKETLDQLSRFMGDILDGKLSQREAAEVLGLTAQGLSHELDFCFKQYLKHSHVFSDEDVNPPRPNASVMDEASHRIRPKMSRMQGVPDCCFRQHGISDYRYSLSSAHLVTRQISDLPLMCQVPQISELG